MIGDKTDKGRLITYSGSEGLQRILAPDSRRRLLERPEASSLDSEPSCSLASRPYPSEASEDVHGTLEGGSSGYWGPVSSEAASSSVSDGF